MDDAFDPLDVLSGSAPPKAKPPTKAPPVRSTAVAPMAAGPLPDNGESTLAPYLRALVAEARDARQELAAIKQSVRRTAFYAAVVGLPVLAVLLLWFFFIFLGLGGAVRDAIQSR